jgi:hypothetical protein
MAEIGFFLFQWASSVLLVPEKGAHWLLGSVNILLSSLLFAFFAFLFSRFCFG